MAYTKDGFPIEAASKIGHIKLVENTRIQRLLAQFETTHRIQLHQLDRYTGHVDMDVPTDIEQVMTIDGGQAMVPDVYGQGKCMAYIQVCAVNLKMDLLRQMRDKPLADPRDFVRLLEQDVWYNPAALPLAGLRLPNESVKETIRRIVDETLDALGLYPVLQFLVSREWDPGYPMPSKESPSFRCRHCGEFIWIPRSTIRFSCTHCNHAHTLADYLGIGAEDPDTWSREETASTLRDALETLVLFHLIHLQYRSPGRLRRTLFIKDGPLLLRDHAGRLVEPIRAFLQHCRDQQLAVNLLGLEKNGDLVAHLKEIQPILKSAGDFFLPDVRYLVEEIAGKALPPFYRNRANYGAKLAVRIGPHHILALNIPTGNFTMHPTPDDLMQYKQMLRLLPELVSYQYDNALLPLVVANSAASIARQPSGGILDAFTDRFVQRPVAAG